MAGAATPRRSAARRGPPGPVARPEQPTSLTLAPAPGPAGSEPAVTVTGVAAGALEALDSSPRVTPAVAPALRRGRSSRVPFRGNANFLARAPVLYHD